MAKKSDRNIVPGALDAKRKAQVNLKDLDTPLGPDLALPHVGNRLVELSAQAAREPNWIWDRAGGKGISGQTRSHLEHIYGSDRLGLEAAINRAANPQATEQIRGMNQRAARRSADPTYGYDGNRGALAQRIRDEGGYVPGTPSSPGVTGTPDSDRLYPNPKDTGSYFQFSRADFPSDRYPNSPLPSVPGPNRLPEPSAPARNSHGLELRVDGTEYPTALPALDSGNPGPGALTGYNPAMMPQSPLFSPPPAPLMGPRRMQPPTPAPTLGAIGPSARAREVYRDQMLKSGAGRPAFRGEPNLGFRQDDWQNHLNRVNAIAAPIQERHDNFPGLDGSAFNAHDFIKTREESSLIPGLITDPIMNELLALMLA